MPAKSYAFSRRALLGGGTALLGGLIAPPLLRAQVTDQPLTAEATYFNASHWGAFYADVEEGQIARIRPFDGDVLPSPQISALAERPYVADRIQAPMVRAGFLRDPIAARGSGRGGEPFVRVSWDQALDLVANEIKRVRQSFGSASIYAGSQGWQSVGSVNAPMALLPRLLALSGGYVEAAGAGGYSWGASGVVLPYVIGSLGASDPQTAWPVLLEKTDTIVLWGAQLLLGNQVAETTSLAHYAYGAFRALKEAGRIRVIGIDPVRTDTIEYLNADWIAPRPNTDVALMLGIAHELYRRQLYEPTFLKRYTVGFEPFRDYLLGTIDGIPKTAAWAAAISGVDAGTIGRLATRLAKGRTMLMAGWSLQRQDHGEQAHWMLITLAAMLGQIGLPGGGFGLHYHRDSGGSPVARAPILRSLSAAPKAAEELAKTFPPWPANVAHAVPVARFSDLFLNPGKTIDFNGTRLTYPDIRLVYWAGGNPFHHQQQVNRLIEAWRRPETIIIQDSFWTASAKMADIVLPATTSFERNDITSGGGFSHRFLFAMQKTIEPLFEARDDYEIFASLASRLGVEQGFTEGRSQMEWVRFFYTDLLQQANALHIAMPDFASFWRKGYVAFDVPEDAKTFVSYADFRADPVVNALGTSSGRIEIFSKQIASYGYDDCPPHPTWIEPTEWLGSAKAKEFPLHLLSSHPKNRLHSQLNNTWLREKYEIAGREPIWISPSDAAARGIKTGDVVRIFNDRGQVLGGAWVTERIMPGVVRMEEGAWYDPLTPGEIGTLGKHGDANVVTLDRGTSRLAQATIAGTTLVEIALYEETPPPVTAFVPPPIDGT